jgi:tetratricopeptide (TPR) repeat protein
MIHADHQLAEFTALLERDGRPAAERMLREAIARPDTPAETCLRLGEVCLGAGLNEAAADALRRSIQLQDCVEARYLLGFACFNLGWYDESYASYRAAEALQPSLVQVRVGIAYLKMQRGDVAGGLADCAAILAETPTIQQLWRDRALLEEMIGRFRDAAGSFSSAAAVCPSDAAAHTGLARAHLALNRPAEAYASACEATRLAPCEHESWALKGKALHRLGRYAESVEAYVNSVARQPNGWLDAITASQSDMVDTYDGLACALRQLNRCEEIVFWCRRALERVTAPGSRELLWRRVFDACLLAGDYEQAWNAYAQLRPGNGKDRPAPAGPRWAGERLDGRALLVHADHGLEYTIPFLRLLPAAKERSGGRIILECAAGLAPLVGGCAGVDLVVPRSSLRRAPAVPYDAHCSLVDLAGLLRATPYGPTATESYLAPSGEAAARWRDHLCRREGLKVGFYLPSRPSAASAGWCALDDLVPELQCVPGVSLIDLRAECAAIDEFGSVRDRCAVGPHVHRDAHTSGRPHARRIAPRRRLDAGEIVAACASLDILICGDGPVAHLGGAAGASTWMLVPSSPSWAWMREGATSPWYSSVRLFREDESAGWASAVRRIVEGVRSTAAGRRARA